MSVILGHELVRLVELKSRSPNSLHARTSMESLKWFIAVDLENININKQNNNIERAYLALQSPKLPIANGTEHSATKEIYNDALVSYRIARNFGGQNFGGFGGLLSKRQNFNRQNRIYMGVYIRLGINPPKY